MRERWLPSVLPLLLSVDGDSTGTISTADNGLFRVKQIVYLKSSSVPLTEFEVKRVYPGHIKVGLVKGNIDVFSDVSGFLVADGATIQASEQLRPITGEQAIPRITFAEEPASAVRTLSVDRYGNPYTTDNPLPVDVGAAGAPIAYFNDANAVAMGVSTDVLTYTVPAGKTLNLQLCEFDGDNVAKYEFKVDGVVIARKHTWFSGPLYSTFDFKGALKLNAGQVVKLNVIHNRPFIGGFSGRILGNLL